MTTDMTPKTLLRLAEWMAEQGLQTVSQCDLFKEARRLEQLDPLREWAMRVLAAYHGTPPSQVAAESWVTHNDLTRMSAVLAEFRDEVLRERKKNEP